MSEAALAARAIGLIDLTELGDTADETAIRRLCTTARGGGAVPPVAALCVWPRHVALARGLWPGRIATVVNFPSGDEPVAAVTAMIGAALAEGADEIDIVLPYRGFLAGDVAAPEAMLRAARAATAAATLKVILETGAFPDAGSIRTASDLAIAAGADFIKTSTGKGPGGATPQAARVMLEAIRTSGRQVGLKPSGGIRTLDDARTYLDLADTIMGPDWAKPETFRFGASGLHASLAAVINRETPRAAESAY